MPKIFLSHSSNDIALVEELNDFLILIGLKSEDIFCSSIEGQGVKNGKRINETIQEKIKTSELIIFVITQSFLKSPYCTNELGAGWGLDSNETSIFIFKSNDVETDELKGFVDSRYKFSLFDSAGLSSLYDEISTKFNINAKHYTVTKNISKFLEQIKPITNTLVENKDKSFQQLQKEKIEKLESRYKYLSDGAKEIIAKMYYSYDRIGYYSLSNGLIGSLVDGLFLHRTTSISTSSLLFAFELQPWVINLIQENNNVQSELKKLI